MRNSHSCVSHDTPSPQHIDKHCNTLQHNLHLPRNPWARGTRAFGYLRTRTEFFSHTHTEFQTWSLCIHSTRHYKTPQETAARQQETARESAPGVQTVYSWACQATPETPPYLPPLPPAIQMSMRECIHMHTHRHTRTHTHAHAHAHVHTHTYRYTSMKLDALTRGRQLGCKANMYQDSMQMSMRQCTRKAHATKRTHTHPNTCTHRHTRTLLFARGQCYRLLDLHTHTHARTRTRTHTQAHTHSLAKTHTHTKTPPHTNELSLSLTYTVLLERGLCFRLLVIPMCR